MSAERYFKALEARITSERDELNALDAAVGDGDHGTTLERGLRRAVAAPSGGRAKAFMRAAGGASGTLFGLVLLEIERHLDEGVDIAEGLGRAVARIRDLGEVREGDKSMIDALGPASDALSQGRGLQAAVAAATAGREATREMAARRGRAQYVENGGRGRLDPGAVSSVMILETLAEVRGA